MYKTDKWLWACVLATLPLFAQACGGDNETTQPAKQTSVALATVIYTAGPSWDPQKPPQKQDMASHFAYVQRLFDQGRLLAYGPFGDDGRGFYVYVADVNDIDQVVADDPGIKNGVLALDQKGAWQLSFDKLSRSLPANQHLFVLEYLPGPSWQNGKPLAEQPIGDHVAYVSALFEKDTLVAGGVVSDTHGRYVVSAKDLSTARALVEADPSVAEGLFSVTVKPWSALARQTVAQAAKRRGQ
jgi:uncharacterized protein YciI